MSQTEQIEGKEVIELSPVKELEGNVKDYPTLTKALMEISPVPIKIEAFKASAKGCYNSLTNEIKIQPDMSEAQTIKTMIHEIAHSIVHSDENLNQLKQKDNVEFSKNEKEVQAESIAYIVSSHLGIDTSDYSFPYVATWGLSTEPSDLENVKQNLKCIKSTSMYLTSKLDTYMKQLQAQDDVALLPDRIETEKKYRTILAREYEYFKDEIEANNLRDTEHFTFYDVKGNEYHDLKEAWDAIQECTKGYRLNDFKENKFVGRFMKADVLIGLGLAGEGIVIKMKTPLRTINVDSVNPVGRVNFNRMYKRINDIRYSLNKTIETIQNYEGNLKIAKEMVNKPFELQDELTSARNRQKEINKILDTSGNENSKVVVEDDLEEEKSESSMEL